MLQMVMRSSIVMASIAMLDLRLLGAFARTQSVLDMTERFVPWIWGAVVVLACSGLLLIIGEPGRELQNQVFWVKMTRLVCALVITGIIAYTSRHSSGFWERRRGAAYATAVVSLLLWTGIVAAGRWTRLQTELDRCEGELAASANQIHDSERAVATALGRRDELRGLLGAYKAKAARLGVAEDADLAVRYDQVRELLWTAPCDITSAEAAVAGYQQAILAAEGRRR